MELVFAFLNSQKHFSHLPGRRGSENTSKRGAAANIPRFYESIWIGCIPSWPIQAFFGQSTSLESAILSVHPEWILRQITCRLPRSDGMAWPMAGALELAEAGGSKEAGPEQIKTTANRIWGGSRRRRRRGFQTGGRAPEQSNHHRRAKWMRENYNGLNEIFYIKTDYFFRFMLQQNRMILKCSKSMLPLPGMAKHWSRNWRALLRVTTWGLKMETLEKPVFSRCKSATIRRTFGNYCLQNKNCRSKRSQRPNSPLFWSMRFFLWIICKSLKSCNF